VLADQVVEHEAAGPAGRAGRSLIGQVEIGAEAAGADRRR
jgi:hypothetical protein